MANNRAYLICNVCLPKGKAWPAYTNDGPMFHLAKWYPAGNALGIMTDGAYYTNTGDGESKIRYVNRLDGFLQRHQHLEANGYGLPNPIRLEYEWMDDEETKISMDDLPLPVILQIMETGKELGSDYAFDQSGMSWNDYVEHRLNKAKTNEG